MHTIFSAPPFGLLTVPPFLGFGMRPPFFPGDSPLQLQCCKYYTTVTEIMLLSVTLQCFAINMLTGSMSHYK